jgi:hypothetical protein
VAAADEAAAGETEAKAALAEAEAAAGETAAAGEAAAARSGLQCVRRARCLGSERRGRNSAAS